MVCTLKDNYWRECLNSDGQQYHQYQQNEQSPLNSAQIIENELDHTCDVDNAHHYLGQSQKYYWWK